MADNQGVNPIIPGDAAAQLRSRFPDMARGAVAALAQEIHEKTDPALNLKSTDVYTVWSCFILGDYKALISTSLPDGRYYEVTINTRKNEMYIDVYVKVDNRCVSLETFGVHA